MNTFNQAVKTVTSAGKFKIVLLTSSAILMVTAGSTMAGSCTFFSIGGCSCTATATVRDMTQSLIEPGRLLVLTELGARISTASGNAITLAVSRGSSGDLRFDH